MVLFMNNGFLKSNWIARHYAEFIVCWVGLNLSA